MATGKVEELRKKIAELEQIAASSHIDVGPAIAAINRKIEEEFAKTGVRDAWSHIQLSRAPERPYTLDYIELIFTDFIEMRGDRKSQDDKAIVGGIARFNGRPLMVIGTQKGRDTKSNLFRNFGWPGPDGYRKARRLMRLADKAGIPIVTFIDTPGAFPGIRSEERHIGEAIAVNLRDMFSLRVPVIAIVIGEGGSGGALGLGVGNRLLMMENSYYSVISPEGCASILWKDRGFAPQAAEALQLTADRLLELGVADEIIPEPAGGAQTDHRAAADNLAAVLSKHLSALRKLSPSRLIEDRYDKFRKIGVFTEATE
ncbi:MAG: acetyl-CoA carboxylase carboxyltransferase subunit alpha [Victivallaceae bacterium]|nr:acetyl-CoA carboxylase carboxyltransferase subunit alpha [Victivallaceae bacterium]